MSQEWEWVSFSTNYHFQSLFHSLGPVVFQIKIHNELDETVSGGIFYEDNVHHAESYAVKSNETFVDDVVPPEPIIKKITGMTDSGVYCLPYILPPSGEPKLKFHIVRNETGGCLIIPASVQYHPIKTVKFTENGNDVGQQDFFHPHTREAILKVPAHGRNLDAAIIFQGKRQRSSGSSIMVTATGHECHIHLIPEELGNIMMCYFKLEYVFDFILFRY